MRTKRPAPRLPTVRRGRPLKEGLREHLLLHTLRVLLRDGYDRFSMNAVAVSARASKETLYRLFEDKAGLIGAAFSQLGQAVEPLLLRGLHSRMTREQHLQVLAENYVDGCLRSESLALQRIAYAHHGEGLSRIFSQHFTDTVFRVITQQLASLHTPQPPRDAEIFLAMVQGQLHERALLGTAEPSTKRIKAVTTHAVHIFLAYANGPAARKVATKLQTASSR